MLVHFYWVMRDNEPPSGVLMLAVAEAVARMSQDLEEEADMERRSINTVYLDLSNQPCP